MNALKEQSDASLKASAEASANAVTAKGDVLKNAVDDQSLPAAKWFAQTFSMSNDGGTMMIVIIAALFFELIHLTTVFSEIRALIKKQELKTNGEYMQNAYFNATGKVYNPDDFKDERVIDLSKDELAPTNPTHNFQDEGYEVRTKGKPYAEPKGNFGFVPSPANARFKWQDSEIELPAKPEKQFGFIPTRNSNDLAAQNRKDYPQTIVMPANSRPTPDDYAPIKRHDLTVRERLRNGEKVYPTGPLDHWNSTRRNDWNRLYIQHWNSQKKQEAQPLEQWATMTLEHPQTGQHLRRITTYTHSGGQR